MSFDAEKETFLRAISSSIAGATIDRLSYQEEHVIEDTVVLPGITFGKLQTYRIAFSFSNGLHYLIGENADWDPGELITSERIADFAPFPPDAPASAVLGQSVDCLAIGARSRLYLVTKSGLAVWKELPLHEDVLEVSDKSAYGEPLGSLLRLS